MTTMNAWRKRLAAAAVGLALAGGATAWAADRTWDGGGANDNWSNPTNWAGMAFTNGDNVFFTNAAAARKLTGTVSASATVSNMTFGGGPGTNWTITVGNNQTLTVNGDIACGDGAAYGTYTIQRSTTYNSGKLALSTGAHTITVTNSGANLSTLALGVDLSGGTDVNFKGNGKLALSSYSSLTSIGTLSLNTPPASGGGVYIDNGSDYGKSYTIGTLQATTNSLFSVTKGNYMSLNVTNITVAAGSTLTFDIAGSASDGWYWNGFSKGGDGTLVITNSNTGFYVPLNGTLQLTAGTLDFSLTEASLQGSIAVAGGALKGASSLGYSSIDIQSGCTFSTAPGYRNDDLLNAAYVVLTIESGGTLDVGGPITNGTNCFSVGEFYPQAGSTNKLDIGDATHANGYNDQIVAGWAVLGGTLELNLGASAFTNGTVATLFQGSWDGDFNAVTAKGQFTGSFESWGNGLWKLQATATQRLSLDMKTGILALEAHLAGAPDIATLAPTNVVSGAAWMNASLISTGAAATTVYVNYGATDQGSTGVWDHADVLVAGTWTNGSLPSIHITNGLPANECWYRFYAVNASGTTWAAGSAYFIQQSITLSSADADFSAYPVWQPPAGGIIGSVADSATLTLTRPASCANGDLTVVVRDNDPDRTNWCGYAGWESGLLTYTIPAGSSSVTVAVQALGNHINCATNHPFLLSLDSGNFVVQGGASEQVWVTNKVCHTDTAWYSGTNAAIRGGVAPGWTDETGANYYRYNGTSLDCSPSWGATTIITNGTVLADNGSDWANIQTYMYPRTGPVLYDATKISPAVTFVKPTGILEWAGSSLYYYGAPDPMYIHDLRIVLDGGTVRNASAPGTSGGIQYCHDWRVKTNSLLSVAGDSASGFRWYGAVRNYDDSSTGILTKTNTGTLFLFYTNSPFTGGWDIGQGWVKACADGALGTNGTVTLHPAGALAISNSVTLYNLISGVGTCGTANATLTLKPGSGDAGMAPGNYAAYGVGTITVPGSLAFAGNGASYCKLEIAVTNAAGIATASVVSVQGSLSGLDNVDLVIHQAGALPVGPIVIMTAANDMTTAPPFHSVTVNGGAGACIVEYGAGVVSIRFLSPDLTIQNGPAPTGANVGYTQAVVSVMVWTNGGSDATGYLFYGTNNVGTNLTWAFTNGPIALPAYGAVTNTLTGLLPATTYYFMYYATNTAGQSFWGGVDGVPFRTKGGYRMQIAFAGYTGRSEALSNFPALVVFSNGVGGSTFNFGKYPFATTNGYDLRFGTNAFDTAGSLNYEIDTWNTNGACYLWVQVPRIPGDGSGSIWASWGDPTEVNQLPCTTNGATWANGFVAVWHMNQANVLDSTANRCDGFEASSTNDPGGSIGLSQGWLVSTPGTRVTNVVSFPVGSAPVSISTWAKQYNNFNSTANMMCYGVGTYGSNPAMQLMREAGTVPVGFTAGTWGDYATASFIQADKWQHVYMTYDGFNATLYGDGAKLLGVTKLWNVTAITEARIGRSWNYRSNEKYMWGSLDEMRIENVTRSSNWVWACYMNQASNITFSRYNNVAFTNLVIQNGTAPVGATLWSTQAVVDTVVVARGPSPATGYLFYGTNNVGTNLTWEFTNSLGALPPLGIMSSTLTNLSPNTTYYFMSYATNTAGEACWGGTNGVPFTTLSGAPAVTNTGASAVGADTAMLNGVMTTGTAAWCAFYWWLGNEPEPTTNVVTLGWLAQGAFSNSIGGLNALTPYGYLCMASNNHGVAWSVVSNFTTLADSDAVWVNTNGGSYAAGTNWDIGSVPSYRRSAFFLSNATYRVDFPGTVTNSAADFEAAGGTVTLNIGGGGTNYAYTNVWVLTNTVSVGTNAGAFATVAVTSGALRASSGVMVLGNGVLTNSGSGKIEVGIPGVASYPLLYVPANMTCTVGQVTIRGSSLDNTWSCGGPGTLILKSAFANPDLVRGATFIVSNGTLKAGAANILSMFWNYPYGGYLLVTNATLDMNGYDQSHPVDGNTLTIAANATMINSGANATWNEGGTAGDQFYFYGTVADGTPGDGTNSGLISFQTYQTVTFYRGGQTLNNLLGRNGTQNGIYTLYSTSSIDHNTIYGRAAPASLSAIFYADTAGNISRTLGGKEADSTTDRFVTIGSGGVYLYIKGDGGTNISNGAYTNNNDVLAGTTIVLARNDSISTNVTYTMRNLANGLPVTTTNGAFKLRFQGTNTLTASSTHTVNGTLQINNVVESGGARALTKAGTGILELYGPSLFSTNLVTAGTMTVSGSVTNRYLELWSNTVLNISGGGYLKATNNLVNTNDAATVKFTASPNAVGRIDVAGSWNNASSSKLVVDLTGYTWPSGPFVVLATFGSMPKRFADGNITVTGAKAVVRQTDNRIVVMLTGTMLLIR